MKADKKTLKLVRELIEEGYGRRRIAQVLETTEWQARGLIKQILDEADISPTKRKQPEEPEMSSGRSKPFKQPKKKKKRTPVTITSTAIQSDVPAELVERDITLRVAVVSDIHYPFEDENAIKICKAYLQDYDPDLIVLNGDVVDCYSVSSYTKDIRKKISIQDELDYGAERLQEWVDEFPGAEFKYVEGNHETRLSRLIKNHAPALASLRTLNIKDNLGLDEMGIEWIPENHDLKVGNLLFLHGHRVRRGAGNTARGHFDDYGCSLIIGHIHRLAVLWKRNKYGNHALIENGTLCDLDVEFARFPDWQQGFTTIDFDGDDFTPTSHLIDNYKLIADGRVYTL